MTDETRKDTSKLGRDVYIALAAVGWADGELDQEEADAIVRTALEEGLDLEEIAEIEEATKQRVDLTVIDRSNLSKEDRLFVYGVALWMARLDGQVTPEELATLDRLGEALRVPEKPRRSVESIVEHVTRQSEDVRPARYDLPALRRILSERLRLAEQRKADRAT